MTYEHQRAVTSADVVLPIFFLPTQHMVYRFIGAPKFSCRPQKPILHLSHHLTGIAGHHPMTMAGKVSSELAACLTGYLRSNFHSLKRGHPGQGAFVEWEIVDL